MFVVTNRIPVSKGHETDFEDRFRNRAHLIDRHPGFIKNLVLRPVQRRFSHQTGTWEDVLLDALGITTALLLIGRRTQAKTKQFKDAGRPPKRAY